MRFVYNTTRPDVVPTYHAGSLLKTTVLLTNVQTYAGASMVADYRLAYAQGSATGRNWAGLAGLAIPANAAVVP